MNEISITGDSYNLKEWRNLIVVKCINDNPSKSRAHLSRLLGISTITFIEYAKYAGVILKKTDKKLPSRITKKELEPITKFTPNGK